VGRIAEGAEVGVVRGDHEDLAAGAHQAVEFLHGAYDVGDMFDDVYGLEGVEGAVFERVGEVVEIGQNVGAGCGVAVDADRTWALVDAAADIEDFVWQAMIVTRLKERGLEPEKAA